MEWLNMADLVVSIIMLVTIALVTIALVFITRRYVILTGDLVKSTNKPEILKSRRLPTFVREGS